MSVAQGNRQRIRRIGADRAVELEEPLDHHLDLLFLGAAAADHCLLDLAGGVFEDARTQREGGAQRGTPGLPELERAIGISVHEDPLNRDLLGAELAGQTIHTAEDLLQSLGQRVPSRTNDATGEVAGSAIARFNDRVTSRQRAGVQAEDAYPRRQCRDLAIGGQRREARRTLESTQEFS